MTKKEEEPPLIAAENGSPDLNKERLSCIKERFPDLFNDEGGMDESALRRLLNYSSEQASGATERYEFNWAGRTLAEYEASVSSKETLTYDAERRRSR